jgi:hypothetical protein
MPLIYSPLSKYHKPLDNRCRLGESAKVFPLHPPLPLRPARFPGTGAYPTHTYL